MVFTRNSNSPFLISDVLTYKRHPISLTVLSWSLHELQDRHMLVCSLKLKHHKALRIVQESPRICCPLVPKQALCYQIPNWPHNIRKSRQPKMTRMRKSNKVHKYTTPCLEIFLAKTMDNCRPEMLNKFKTSNVLVNSVSF